MKTLIQYFNLMKLLRNKSLPVLILFYVNLAIFAGGALYWSGSDLISWKSDTKQLTEYDDLIQKYSQRYGLDWRFVSSIIDAESSFNTDAVSPAGAMGLMQIMPQVASAEGVTDTTDPEQNIRAGVKHFKKYFHILQGETMEDTLKINLAAYNAGIAHVKDAKKLAVYLHMNPREWKSLEQTFPLLEQDDFQPFIDYGYCKGSMVVAYINKVFKKYNLNRKAFPHPAIETKNL